MKHLRQYSLETALVIVAALATWWVFTGSARAAIFVASLFIVAALFWLRKIAIGLYGSIEVIIGLIALWDASGNARGAFSADFSNDFQRYQWTIILLQTAAAIYLTIRGCDNLNQWWGRRYSPPATPQRAKKQNP
jgi:hypothetical protein